MLYQPNRSRRNFLYNASLTAMALSAIPIIGCANNQEQAADKKKSAKSQGKLGIALVGLGGYSEGQLAPALQETEHCYLAGIVTGTPDKADKWKKKYDIPEGNIYNYQTFDKIKDNPDIDIIYVVLPNSMHAEYVVRAAQAGKHVICEKPMALTVAECDQMIDACKKAGKMLSIGYRLHFDPYNLEMVRLGTQKVYGNLKSIQAGDGFTAGDPTQWRLKKAMAGGGPLQDVGVYCIQGICYTSGLEPIAVTAKEGPKTDPEKFKEVEQSISWEFEMPGGLKAQGTCSYAENMSYLKAEAEKGSFQLDPAYGYNGLAGSTPAGKMDYPKMNQQAKQMDDFAMAIKNKRPTPVPGEMGRRDVKIIQAIYQSAASGKKVTI